MFRRRRGRGALGVLLKLMGILRRRGRRRGWVFKPRAQSSVWPYVMLVIAAAVIMIIARLLLP